MGLRWSHVAGSAFLAAAVLGTPAFGITLTHDYTLQNTLSDSSGGPALVNNGGTLTAGGLAFGPGENMDVVVSRNGAEHGLVRFADGTEEGARCDTGCEAVLGGSDQVAYFFKDDAVHGGAESGGVVMEIKLYSRAVTATDTDCGPASDGGSLPEPANVLLMGLSLLGLVGRSSWRRAG